MIQSRATPRILLHLHRITPTQSCVCHFSSAVASVDPTANEDSALVRFRQLQLGHGLPPLDLTIQSSSHGGHIILGRNGTGKSKLLHSVLHEASSTTSLEHVSFESHLELLQRGGTVYKALAQGNLNKAAQFLIVRFGLFPLLHQDVRTLSNGQIKKVLIVRALSHRPALLLLDNAFDGLDVASREVLKQLVSKTLQGFSRDILVQGVSARNTAKTQVIQITQRAEEIVDEFKTLTFLELREGGQDDHNHTSSQNRQNKWRTVTRERRTSQELLDLALHSSTLSNNDILPNAMDLEKWWQSLHDTHDKNTLTELVNIDHLSIERNGKSLLKDLTWKVRRGERWIVGGNNGAGKSTLSRLLAHREEETTFLNGTLDAVDAERVGWVSTERHMSLAHSDTNAKQLFPSNDTMVAKWLGVDHLMDRRFAEVSQGEQRLILIASAIASRPPLLVFDEPCQGLDLLNRQRVLDLVQRICETTDMSLIYITHHLEEQIPAIRHALHLVEGEIVFSGDIRDYEPENFSN